MRDVVRWNTDLYRMIIAAQRDDSHQSKCIRLKSGVNAVTRDLGFKRTVCFAGEGAVKASEYKDLGRVIEYKYGKEVSNTFRGNIPLRFLRYFGMSKTYYNFPVSIKVFIETLKTNKQIRMGKYFKKCV